jgi:hypothetical protein
MQWYIKSMNKAVFLVEVLCTDAQRDVVRQHWLVIAQGTEDALF